MNVFLFFFAPLLALGAFPTLGVVVMMAVHLAHHLFPRFGNIASLAGDLWIGLGFAVLLGDHYGLLLRLVVSITAVVAGLMLKRYNKD
jgi:hypothetical protein